MGKHLQISGIETTGDFIQFGTNGIAISSGFNSTSFLNGDVSFSDVLTNDNITDGNNISLSTGDSIIFNNGTNSAIIIEPVLTEDINLTLPTNNGTFALVSDIYIKPYQVYSAFLTQTSTNAPVATVVENTLNSTSGTGIPIWSYDGVGAYTITQFGGFSTTKTALIFEVRIQGSASLSKSLFYGAVNDVDSMYIGTIDTNGGESEANDIFSDTFIEIRVYN